MRVLIIERFTQTSNAPEISQEVIDSLGFDTSDLVKLASWPMPFGKYQGKVIIDLPEEYLFWFSKNEFPAGKLGDLMQLCLALKVEGLDSLIKPLAREREFIANSREGENRSSESSQDDEGEGSET